MKAFVLVEFGYGDDAPKNLMVIMADTEVDAIAKLDAAHPGGYYTETVRGKLKLTRIYSLDEIDTVLI